MSDGGVTGIIDYRMGNLRSVQKAFEFIGTRADILTEPGQVVRVDKLVLPGVGAFADGMTHLDQMGWIDPIHEHISSGKPFLGICLGLQLLFESSDEDAPSPDEPVPGLGILPGRVIRFNEDQGEDCGRLKVPHMGWNTLRWERGDPVLSGLDQETAVYFVHSYYASPSERAGADLTSAYCEYGVRFTASIWRDSIWATQFHPEKSQRVGLKILANFAEF